MTTQHKGDPTPYMVFAGRKYKTILGEAGINWNHDNSIIGVFFAHSEEEACQAASVKAGFAGTFFAIEGFAWGIDQFETRAREYGVAPGKEDRLDRIEQMLEKTAGQLPRATTEDELDKLEHQIDEIEELADDEPTKPARK